MGRAGANELRVVSSPLRNIGTWTRLPDSWIVPRLVIQSYTRANLPSSPGRERGSRVSGAARPGGPAPVPTAGSDPLRRRVSRCPDLGAVRNRAWSLIVAVAVAAGRGLSPGAADPIRLNPVTRTMPVRSTAGRYGVLAGTDATGWGCSRSFTPPGSTGCSSCCSHPWRVCTYNRFAPRGAPCAEAVARRSTTATSSAPTPAPPAMATGDIGGVLSAALRARPLQGGARGRAGRRGLPVR